MKIGDYVRTKYGIIAKRISANEYDKEHPDYYVDDYIFDTGIYYKYDYYDEVVSKDEFEELECKIKSNIIDLIEVGDYVNGHKVLEKNNHYVEVESADIQSETWEKIYCNDIKSIVTKEQFSQVEYKVGE